MKIEFILKEGIHLIPFITGESICFLFFIIYFKKDKSYVFKTGYITPNISLSWYQNNICLWVGWLNDGIVINFTEKNIQQTKVKR